MKRPNGYGNIHYLGKGRRKPYGARVTIDTADGKIIRKYIGYYSKRMDAEQALHDYYNYPEKYNKITFDDLYHQWISTKKGKIADKTLKTYQGFYSHLEPILSTPVQDIRLYHLQSILDDCKDYSHSFQKQLKTVMVQVLQIAVVDDLIHKNYGEFVQTKAKEQKQKVIFKSQDIKTLWANLEYLYVDSLLSLIYTGLRIGELLSLKKDQIDLDLCTITGGSKTDSGKKRVIPIADKILPLVRKNMFGDSDYLICRDGKPIRHDYYRKYIFKDIINHFNFNNDLTPHSTRHTFASLLNRSVSNKQYIQKIMGHSDYSITANIYTHTEIEELKRAINTL